MSIMLVPVDVDTPVQPPWVDRPGADGAVVGTASGRKLVVSIEPFPESPDVPLDADDMRELAQELAPRY